MQNSSNRQSPVLTICTYILWIVCCVGIEHSSAKTGSTSPQTFTKTVPDDVVEKIDNFIKSTMNCSISPALSVSVVKDGRVVLSKGYGYTSANKTKKVTSQTKFAIGSLTKAFTALLIAKWVKETENITFDTPIKQFLPDFRLVDDYRSEHASLRDILGHRMALPREDSALLFGIDSKMSRKELSSKFKYLQTPFSFREKAIYNNYMYILAGDILERLSQGRSWESLIRETIFNPLSMTQSGFVNLVKDFSDDFALPCHLLNGSLIDIDPVAFKIGQLVGPAGTIYSTADDMAKWMMFLLSKDKPTMNTSRLDLDSSMVEMTFEPSIRFLDYDPIDFFKPEYPVSHQENDYCMGWITAIYREYRKIFHLGGIVTHRTHLWLYPDASLGIFIAINGPDKNQTQLPNALPYYISDLLFGLPTWFNYSDVCAPHGLPWNKKEEEGNQTTPQPDTTPFHCTAATQCRLSDYVGIYSHKVYGDASISLSNDIGSGESNKLYFIFGLFGKFELTPKSSSSFTGRIFDGPFWFLSDDEFSVNFTFCKNGDESENNRVISLQMGLGESVGPFNKKGVSDQTNTGAQVQMSYWSHTCVLLFAVFHFLS